MTSRRIPHRVAAAIWFLTLALITACVPASVTGDESGLQPASLQPTLRDAAPTAAAVTTPTPRPTQTPSPSGLVDAVDDVDDVDCPSDPPDFAGKTVADVRFSDDLTCSSFVGAVVERVSFAATSLNGADFRNAIIRNSEFDSVTAYGTDFRGATFEGVTFEESDLSGASVDETAFSATVFEGSICPNGAQSDENLDSCIDILGAKD